MNRLQSFLRSESGSGSYMAVGGLMFTAVIGGLALDYTSGLREKTRLQIAADASALAAAALIDDQSIARATAAEVAYRNLGNRDIIRASDIEFGYVNETTGVFTASSNDDEINAARAIANRNETRDNSLDTLLLRIMGLDYFELEIPAVAGARRGGGGGALAGCEDATFISENWVNTGGGIDLSGAVCMHGRNGVRTGGGDTYVPEVRFSSEELDNVVVNNYSPSSIPIDQLRIARTLEPVILPELQSMHTDLWSEISGGCDWTNDDREIDGAYTGDALPSFIGEGGSADLVCINNWWTVQPGELSPNTIYLSKSGVQFAGGIDATNIAIISQGPIGVGGGPALSFDEVFFFGTDLNMAGNISWGPQTGDCSDDRFSVYTFGLSSLSLGGWSTGTKVNNVVGAAPRFAPGGAMAGTGMYFEAEQTIQLGGDLEITGCDNAYTSEIEIAETGIPEGEEASGSFLLQ